MASPAAKIQEATDNVISQPTALVSTPTSTPSPSACIQVIKQAKAPVSQPTIMASNLNPTNQETPSIVQTVMEQISEQLKTIACSSQPTS